MEQFAEILVAIVLPLLDEERAGMRLS